MVTGVIYAKATSHYDCGVQIGRQARPHILKSIRGDKRVEQVIEYTHTEKGKALFDDFLELHQKTYPSYVDEVRGIADGSEIPFQTVFSLNIIWELAGLSGITFTGDGGQREVRPEGAGCSDFHIHTAETKAWGHTEDCPAVYKDTSYIVVVDVCPEQKEEERESYVAFCYPGYLAGWAWGYNRHGVVMSINALDPGNDKVGLGVSFVARSILSARSLDQAIALAKIPQQGGGVSVNMGSIHELGRRLNIETSPRAVTVLDIPFPSIYPHVNVYRHTNVSGEDIRSSSIHRMKRIEEMCSAHVPKTRDDILDILSDSTDEEYPIFRGPWSVKESTVATLVTVLFDMIEGKAYVYEDRPNVSEPKYVFDLSAVPVQE